MIIFSNKNNTATNLSILFTDYMINRLNQSSKLSI